MSSVAIRRLDTRSEGFEAAFQRVLHWSAETDAAIEQRVVDIVADVRVRGDAAVLEYTRRFDRVDAHIAVSGAWIQGSEPIRFCEPPSADAPAGEKPTT